MKPLAVIPLLLTVACARTSTRSSPDAAGRPSAAAMVADTASSAPATPGVLEITPDAGSPEHPARPFPVELPPGAEYRGDLGGATTRKCMESWTVYAMPMPLDQAVAFYEEHLGSPVERTADEVVFDLGDRGRVGIEPSRGLRTLRVQRDLAGTSSAQRARTLLRYVDRYPCTEQQGDEPATADRYPSRAAAHAKLEGVREAVGACTGGRTGAAVATIRFDGSSGRVLSVEVSGDFAGAAATCIADVVRGVSLPPFPGSSVSVRYTYRF